MWGAVADESVARLFEVNVSLLGLFCGCVGLFCGYICGGLLLMRVWHAFLRRMCHYEGSFADV